MPALLHLYTKKGADHGCHYYQEHTGAKPGGSHFTGIRIPTIPFLVHFHCPDQSKDRTYSVH